MGEMADMALEEVEYYEDLRLAYHRGEMSDVEAYDAGLIDELGFEPNSSTGKFKTCRCCGTEGLHWEQVNGKWRLHDAGGQHKCPVNPLKETITEKPKPKEIWRVTYCNGEEVDYDHKPKDYEVEHGVSHLTKFVEVPQEEPI